MIANKIINSTFQSIKNKYFTFSTLNKKKQMELTLRTPYKTIVSDFSGFSRIITKTQQSTLVVQNRTPPALHILPPGYLKLKLTQQTKGVSGDYLHTGGWMIVHADNTCEINLMDIAEKSQVKADMIDKVEIKETESIASKYANKSRKATSKTFLKRSIA